MKDLIRKAGLLFTVILVFTFLGCEDDDEGTALPAVTAGFTFDLIPNTGSVSFINISENANTFEWDFGNGTTSTEINPTVTFVSGTYTVSLTANNVAGASATFEDEITISIPESVTLPIDFDGTNVAYDAIEGDNIGFSIVTNPETGNGNTTNVGQMVAGGGQFQNVQFPLGTPVDFSGENRTIQLELFSSAEIAVLVKFENGVGGARDVEVLTTHTGSGWETLNFNFATDAVASFIPEDPQNGQPLVPDGQYGQMILFIGFSADPGVEGTFLVDNIVQAGTMAPGFDSGLLTNGDFENGVDPWIGNAANVQTDGGNSFNLADVTMAGDAFTVNLSQVVAITQGTNYILTFDASSDRNRTMLAGIGLNEAPFTNTAPSVNLTTDTQTFTLQLSAVDFGGANSRVLFDMGAEVGTVVIDNVSLVEGGDGSDTTGGGGGFDSGLLTNGDFENGADPWIGNAANVQTDGDNSFNFADVTTAGDAFSVNLSQVVAITQGTNYILTFDASSDRNRTMLAGIGLNEAPFTNTAPSVNLTTDTQTFTLQLSAVDFGGANSRVLFDMGADVGTVVIDNVSLVEGGDGSDTNGGGGGGFDSGLLTNGDFESGAAPWIQGVDDNNPAPVITENGNSFFSINVTSPDPGQPFLVNLSQKLEITQDATYTLTFDAWSDTNRSIIAGIGLSGGSFANTTETVNITTTRETYSVMLTATGFGAADARVLFDLNGEAGLVNIDDVSLVLDSGGSGGGGCSGGPTMDVAAFPVDFENCEGFNVSFGSLQTREIVDNPVSGGINTSDKVYQFSKPSGAEGFGGFQNIFNMGTFTNNATITFKIYSTQPNQDVRLEIIAIPNDGGMIGNPAPYDQTLTTANEWVEMSFDLSVNAFPNSGDETVYTMLVVKPGNIDGGNTPADVTFYLDDFAITAN